MRRALLISERVGELAGPVSVFPAAPERSEPLLGDRWIAVGDAAVAWDGTPSAAMGSATGCGERSLATAVADAIASGEPSQPCLDHYTARLGEVLRAHLHRCLAYYATMSSSPAAWRGRMRGDGARAVGHGPSASPPAFSYRLHGRRLVPAGARHRPLLGH